jgi:glycolate oxidase
LLKRAGMRQELSPGVLAMQVAVKRTLDPLNLFNPGKVIG